MPLYYPSECIVIVDGFELTMSSGSSGQSVTAPLPSLSICRLTRRILVVDEVVLVGTWDSEGRRNIFLAA